MAINVAGKSIDISLSKLSGILQSNFQVFDRNILAFVLGDRFNFFFNIYNLKVSTFQILLHPTTIIVS